MTDVRPDNRHRVAYLVGRIFHPYIICIPTLIAVLSDLPPDQVLGWSALVLSMLLLPTLTFGFYLQRRGQELYQRQIRNPLYLLGWLSVLVCLALIVGLEGPRVLIACLGALAVWVPLQGLINALITKLSAHAAVAAGCYTGLLLLGKLDNLAVRWLLLAFVLVTVWSRVRTKNHTFPQVDFRAAGRDAAGAARVSAGAGVRLAFHAAQEFDHSEDIAPPTR